MNLGHLMRSFYGVFDTVKYRVDESLFSYHEKYKSAKKNPKTGLEYIQGSCTIPMLSLIHIEL